MASTSCWSFTFNPLNHKHQLFPCKYNSSTFSLLLIFSPPKHARELSPLFLARQNVVSPVVVASFSTTEHEQTHRNTPSSRTLRENRIGFRSLMPRDNKVGNKYGEKHDNSVVEENMDNNNKVGNGKNVKENPGLRQNKETRLRDKYSNGEVGNVKRNGKQVGEEKNKKKEKGSKKSKVDLPEVHLRVGLDTCSKIGDVRGAIGLFDWAQREGIKLGQYHYTVLLYLCSSAAVGIVQPAKSGTASSLEGSDSSDEGMGGKFSGNNHDVENNDGYFDEKERMNWFCNGLVKRSYRLLDGLSRGNENDSLGIGHQEDRMIRVDEELKDYARERGFEIFAKMGLDNVGVNEATLTSVARLAMSTGNGDMAFDMVKKMKSMGINPRLRSYGPALSAFCSAGDIDKAFAVEEHMLENGVYPEERELRALLRLSVGAGKGNKVYYLLHKLRVSVRKVSASTADLVMDWFHSKAASRFGKTKWDKRSVQQAAVNGGGGWHGTGWFGRGKWSVLQATVGTDGMCSCCGEKLSIIDLDLKETEKFAESVSAIAIKREKHSSFQKFQKWLDYYGPFEAVVDGANVGLFSNKKFVPSKINAVFNGIRQKLPSKKWPLIVLHNRHFNGPKMDGTFNRALFDKWRNVDAIYATPTGSNDDWYWLYAAIKFKCLLVTNDEMRDHTFQLLGDDFFPKWKERHQVRFTFSETGPEFHMPPPCSVVIQESADGHWHIPISSDHEYEAARPWLCIMRAKSRVKSEGSVIGNEEHESRESGKLYKNLKDILSGTTVLSDHHSILPKIESAEMFGECTIDFQI